MANLISLSQLFNNNIFRIPDYQRGYAWEKEQLEDFWQDLNNLTNTALHYTGMISKKEINELSKEEKWALKNNKVYHIVDGQQRLTTCIILINELIKKNLSHLNGEKLEDIKSKYILKQEKSLKCYVFGYEVDNPSFDYFKYGILRCESQHSELQESYYTVKMKSAQDFFAEKIKDLPKEEIDDIYLKLTNNLMFIDYDISKDFDVYTVFEVMNDRGKPLSNLEKFKNRLIYLTTAFSQDKYSDDEKDNLRSIINSAWKEIYKQLGHSKERVLKDDDYLKAHWILFYKYSRQKGDDYIVDLLDKRYTIASIKKYNQLAETEEDEECMTPEHMQNYVESLQNTAKFWYYSHYPDDAQFLNADEKDYLRKLNRIGMGNFRPLVVASIVNSAVTNDERLALFKAIERFIFIVFRMGKANSTLLASEVNSRAKLLFEGSEKIENITKYINSKTEELIPSSLTKFSAKVEENVKREGYYTNREFLKYFFFEYEVANNALTKITDWDYFTGEEKGKISIEHICPQTSTKWYWRNQFRGYTQKEIEILTGSLGNLLPLSQKINSSLQNNEFEDKKKGKNGRRGYSQGSFSEIEVATNFEDWNPTTIKERGIKLLEFMEKRWDFKFNPNDKLKLLGIEFVEDGRTIPQPLPKPAPKDRDDSLKDYLKNKNFEMIDLYDALVEKLKEKIPEIEEISKNPYIAIKNENGKNIAEVRIQSKQIKINIYKPLKIENQIGETEKSEYWGVHNYCILLKKAEQLERFVEAILDSNSQN